MLRGRGFIIILLALLAVLFLCQTKTFAESATDNAELLNEVRSLKRTVEQQQQRIEELEKRLLKQEAASESVGAKMAVSEIDQRIDERLSQKAPAYQLMEGLSLGLEATAIVLGGQHVNGDSQLSKNEDVTDATLTTKISLEKKFGDYAEGYVLLKAGQGEGLDRSLRVYSNVNDNADDNSNVHLSEAWYELYFKQISGALAFGKLDPTNYIDTNDYANIETAQFLGGMFCNSAVIEFPSSNGAGVHFGLAPFDLFDINLVAVDGKGEWNNVFDTMFLAGQINFKPKLLCRSGNYRILAWSNGTNHTKWSDTTREKENSYGWGLSFDQDLSDVIGVFSRYGWQDPKVFTNGSAFSLERSWSIGPQIKGTLWGRPYDVAGIGFGQITPSKKYKTESSVLAKTESHLECYYNYKVNDHLSLSPDMQIIWQPYGKDAANGDATITVWGLRGQMDF